MLALIMIYLIIDSQSCKAGKLFAVEVTTESGEATEDDDEI